MCDSFILAYLSSTDASQIARGISIVEEKLGESNQFQPEDAVQVFPLLIPLLMHIHYKVRKNAFYLFLSILNRFSDYLDSTSDSVPNCLASLICVDEEIAECAHQALEFLFDLDDPKYWWPYCEKVLFNSKSTPQRIKLMFMLYNHVDEIPVLPLIKLLDDPIFTIQKMAYSMLQFNDQDMLQTELEKYRTLLGLEINPYELDLTPKQREKYLQMQEMMKSKKDQRKPARTVRRSRRARATDDMLETRRQAAEEAIQDEMMLQNERNFQSANNHKVHSRFVSKESPKNSNMNYSSPMHKRTKHGYMSYDNYHLSPNVTLNPNFNLDPNPNPEENQNLDFNNNFSQNGMYDQNYGNYYGSNQPNFNPNYNDRNNNQQYQSFNQSPNRFGSNQNPNNFNNNNFNNNNNRTPQMNRNSFGNNTSSNSPNNLFNRSNSNANNMNNSGNNGLFNRSNNSANNMSNSGNNSYFNRSNNPNNMNNANNNNFNRSNGMINSSNNGLFNRPNNNSFNNMNNSNSNGLFNRSNGNTNNMNTPNNGLFNKSNSNANNMNNANNSGLFNRSNNNANNMNNSNNNGSFNRSNNMNNSSNGLFNRSNNNSNNMMNNGQYNRSNNNDGNNSSLFNRSGNNSNSNMNNPNNSNNMFNRSNNMNNSNNGLFNKSGNNSNSNMNNRYNNNNGFNNNPNYNNNMNNRYGIPNNNNGFNNQNYNNNMNNRYNNPNNNNGFNNQNNNNMNSRYNNPNNNNNYNQNYSNNNYDPNGNQYYNNNYNPNYNDNGEFGNGSEMADGMFDQMYPTNQNASALFDQDNMYDDIIQQLGNNINPDSTNKRSVKFTKGSNSTSNQTIGSPSKTEGDPLPFELVDLKPKNWEFRKNYLENVHKVLSSTDQRYNYRHDYLMDCVMDAARPTNKKVAIILSKVITDIILEEPGVIDPFLDEITNFMILSITHFYGLSQIANPTTSPKSVKSESPSVTSKSTTSPKVQKSGAASGTSPRTPKSGNASVTSKSGNSTKSPKSASKASNASAADEEGQNTESEVQNTDGASVSSKTSKVYQIQTSPSKTSKIVLVSKTPTKKTSTTSKSPDLTKSLYVPDTPYTLSDLHDLSAFDDLIDAIILEVNPAKLINSVLDYPNRTSSHVELLIQKVYKRRPNLTLCRNDLEKLLTFLAYDAYPLALKLGTMRNSKSQPAYLEAVVYLLHKTSKNQPKIYASITSLQNHEGMVEILSKFLPEEESINNDHTRSISNNTNNSLFNNSSNNNDKYRTSYSNYNRNQSGMQDNYDNNNLNLPPMFILLRELKKSDDCSIDLLADCFDRVSFNSPKHLLKVFLRFLSLLSRLSEDKIKENEENLKRICSNHFSSADLLSILSLKKAEPEIIIGLSKYIWFAPQQILNGADTYYENMYKLFTKSAGQERNALIIIASSIEHVTHKSILDLSIIAEPHQKVIEKMLSQFENQNRE
ncbi:hypothetical protein M9Y10_029241 [Tritrichomonas musculus]|uniref:Uncharacterized protein n=1 Tax=Tritrichomonas musculus TaxID=1915356 RepID=A0ABR2KLK9_9EUKA